MGFEALDVASMVVQQSLQPLFETNEPIAHAAPAQVATDFVADSPSAELLAAVGVQLVEQSNGFEIYLKDAHIRLRAADASLIAMDYGASTITADDLVRWLDQSLFQKLPDLTQGQRSAYFRAVVSHLMHERGLPLVALARARFKLAQDIETRVGDLKDKAAKASFRQLVPEETWTIAPDWTRPLVFEASRYPVPAGSRYSGRYEFHKHFYPVLADLKDGGEEFSCAQLLTRIKRGMARQLDALLA